jgi:hypothetical protein
MIAYWLEDPFMKRERTLRRMLDDLDLQVLPALESLVEESMRKVRP